MAESIIEGITDFFMECPLLKDGVFHVNAMGDQAVRYAIETGVFDPVITTYINGDTERIYQFNFTSREFYSLDRLENIENSAFYEKLAEWVEAQNMAYIFPELPEKCEARALHVLSSGYLFDASMMSARYQIQMQLDYYKEV